MNFKETGTGIITHLKKTVDPPWTFGAFFFVKCPDETTIRVEKSYPTETDIPKVGDTVAMIFDGNFWRLKQ